MGVHFFWPSCPQDKFPRPFLYFASTKGVVAKHDNKRNQREYKVFAFESRYTRDLDRLEAGKLRGSEDRLIDTMDYIC